MPKQIVIVPEQRKLIAQINSDITLIFDTRGQFDQLMQRLIALAETVTPFSDLDPIPDDEVIPPQLRGRTFARVVGRHFALKEEKRLVQIYYVELHVNPEHFVPVFIVGSSVHFRNRLFAWDESVDPKEPPKPVTNSVRMKKRKRS